MFNLPMYRPPQNIGYMSRSLDLMPIDRGDTLYGLPIGSNHSVITAQHAADLIQQLLMAQMAREPTYMDLANLELQRQQMANQYGLGTGQLALDRERMIRDAFIRSMQLASQHGLGTEQLALDRDKMLRDALIRSMQLASQHGLGTGQLALDRERMLRDALNQSIQLELQRQELANQYGLGSGRLALDRERMLQDALNQGMQFNLNRNQLELEGMRTGMDFASRLAQLGAEWLIQQSKLPTRAQVDKAISFLR